MSSNAAQCCCCYHKGTYFQANHNTARNLRKQNELLLLPQRYVFSSKSQRGRIYEYLRIVVVATTKVRIFKQITTVSSGNYISDRLLLLPQRYVFSSKSQQDVKNKKIEHGCCCYHKGTYFQANHNIYHDSMIRHELLLLPQRYVFSSKSQPPERIMPSGLRCCCYHKGTYFQANHNRTKSRIDMALVVVATTKVRIFKQITTGSVGKSQHVTLLLLPQRYVFSSKSQQWNVEVNSVRSCCCYHKGTYFQANHNR